MTTINVAVIAYPDGSTVHIKDATAEQIRKANKGWWSARAGPQFERYRDVIGGVVFIRMPESDYEAIPATNHPAILALHK